MLLYSIVNVVVVLLSLSVIAAAFFGEEENLRTLIASGIDSFPTGEHLHGFVWLLVYLVSALLFAEVSGSTQLLLRIRVFIATLFFYGDNWTHSTIWFWAIDDQTRTTHPRRAVGARVILKDGTLYTGVMANYPVVRDDVAKDFVLQHVNRYNAQKGAFEPFGPRMSLLLNSGDCWSIQVGPGPEQEPPARSLWEQGMQFALWFALIGLAFAAFATLLARPLQDLLLRLLEFFTAGVTTWSVLALVRYRLRETAPPRWDEVLVQRLWLFAGATAMASTTLWLAGVHPAVGVAGVVAALALTALSLWLPISRTT